MSGMLVLLEPVVHKRRQLKRKNIIGAGRRNRRTKSKYRFDVENEENI